MRTSAAVLAASHPLPVVAVTGLATTVSVTAGRSLVGCVLVAAAVLAGQLSIGLGNDLVDRDRDLAAGRRDKPLATGEVSARAVRVACVCAAVATVPLSLASGVTAGLAHLVGVGGGWAYNLGLKRTIASFVPYAVSFALLAAFLTLGLPGAPWPAPWLLVAAALLGVGAHLLNVVPDIEADLAQDVRGLPQRLGATRSAVAGSALLATAAVVVVLGPDGGVPPWAWAGLGLAVGSAGLSGAAGLRRDPGPAPFRLAVLTAAVTVALLAARGAALT